MEQHEDVRPVLSILGQGDLHVYTVVSAARDVAIANDMDFEELIKDAPQDNVEDLLQYLKEYFIVE